MPPRRRPAQISAAALPASRLPLGTPTFSSFKSPASARTTSSTEKENMPDSRQSSADSADSLDMASTNPSEPSLTKSIAEAKLERQRKRIEEADAPLSIDKRKQSSRGKGKQWKPFDFTIDTPKSTRNHDGGVAVSEVRVNTFRALSRETSSVRSASLLSQRTSETGPSDMERQDSALTEHGFQVFTGRRNRKTIGELNAYEDKPEERQVTVEATFDKREIYDVFGNALPGPEFIVETVGHKNGQVQFIQHPNGDVSAQQWSSQRYMWENIGQFSNIRKKVEGQLASDRLKGETAYQTLQQNTLYYFRTIAKQREANVMGLPFGPKEIQANMPHQPRSELAAAPMGLKETTRGARTVDEQSTVLETKARGVEGPPVKKLSSSLKPGGEPFLPQAILRNQNPSQPLFGASRSQLLMKQEDPFCSASTFKQTYGGNPYSNQYHNYNTKTPTPMGPFFGVSQRPQGLNYDFHFPPAGADGDRTRLSSTHGRAFDHTAASSTTGTEWQRSDEKHLPGPAAQRSFQFLTTSSQNQNAFHNASGMFGTPANVIAAPQPKPAVPFNNRASMSDQLWKISETAKERNLSQSNISRTVLYDPYRKQQSGTISEPQTEQAKPATSSSGPTLSSNIAGKKLQPPTTFDPTSKNFFPTVLAPHITSQIVQPLSPPVSGILDNNLQESSPDTQWNKKPYHHTTPLNNPSNENKATPQNFKGPFFTASENLHETDSKSMPSNKSKKTYDEELSDWWTSGNKFARQEEFFESIKTAHKGPSNNTLRSPPAHLAPIGPPSRTLQKSEQAPFNPTTTRLLIPVLENLASYVQGPPEKRRDYFCQWSQPPDWCIDRSEGGNNSFFDKDWGQPPARVGRDPRYQNRSWAAEQTTQSNRYGSSSSHSSGYPMNATVGSGIDRRFSFGGRY